MFHLCKAAATTQCAYACVNQYIFQSENNYSCILIYPWKTSLKINKNYKSYFQWVQDDWYLYTAFVESKLIDFGKAIWWIISLKIVITHSPTVISYLGIYSMEIELPTVTEIISAKSKALLISYKKCYITLFQNLTKTTKPTGTEA